MRTAARSAEVVTLPPGKVLVPGTSDPQVALLRQRLKVRSAAHGADRPTHLRRHAEGCRHRLPDRERHAARWRRRQRHARAAQRRRGAEPAKLLANMEEWRWMPARPRRPLRHRQHPRVHAAHRQERRRHPHRARHHRPRRTSRRRCSPRTMKSIAFQPRWNVPNSIKVLRALSEPRPRRHLLQPPGPAPVARTGATSTPRASTGPIPISAATTSTSRRAPATCSAS